MPIIERKIVGVKLPESGTGKAEAVDVGVAVSFGVAVGVADCVGVAEGVETKAGPSAAWTMKFLVNVLVIPAASFQEMVILCSPGERSLGISQFQSPDFEITACPVTGSDSTVI